MYETVKEIRVRYGETDKMGFVYHGNYPLYYEEGRTDAIRKLGFAYSDLEAEGILLPVAEMNMRFKGPAFYDELLTVKTTLIEMPSKRMKFHTDIYNQKGDWINTGQTTVLCVRADTKKICELPQHLKDAVAPYFEGKKVE